MVVSGKLGGGMEGTGLVCASSCCLQEAPPPAQHLAGPCPCPLQTRGPELMAAIIMSLTVGDVSQYFRQLLPWQVMAGQVLEASLLYPEGSLALDQASSVLPMAFVCLTRPLCLR